MIYIQVDSKKLAWEKSAYINLKLPQIIWIELLCDFISVYLFSYSFMTLNFKYLPSAINIFLLTLAGYISFLTTLDLGYIFQYDNAFNALTMLMLIARVCLGIPFLLWLDNVRDSTIVRK